jgi:hypothetical protein
MALDLPRTRVLVTDSDLRSLFAIDLETRHSKLLMGDTPLSARAIAVDPTDSSVFVGCAGSIVRLDEEAASHTVDRFIVSFIWGTALCTFHPSTGRLLSRKVFVGAPPSPVLNRLWLLDYLPV